MAFEGGPLNVIGINGQFLSSLGTTAFQTLATDATRQVFQGSGQSFLGEAGQAIVGNLAGSVANVALNSVLGTQVTGPGGLKLDSGQNILATVISPYVTSSIAAGINQSISQSLQSAGPFGPALSGVATGLVNQLFGGLGNALTGASGFGESYKSFPGGGGEPPADYGGNAYTLGPNGKDVVFSIQPANQGPQAFGLTNLNFAKSSTTMSAIDYTKAPATTAFNDSSLAKLESFNWKPTTGTDFTAGNYDVTGALDLPALSGAGALDLSSQTWTFITAPEDISWDVANQADRVNIFGTNNPPVVAGSRGMRDLTLSNSLVEGFIRGVTVEDKIAALENLLNYGLDGEKGFVSVPVYQVWANEKAYGNGYYIIKDVKVKETMRDLKGNATRASVDISFIEVPEYQVGSGRDQASAATAGAKSSLISEAQTRAIEQAASAQAATAQAASNPSGRAATAAASAQANGRGQSNVNNPSNRSGPSAPAPVVVPLPTTTEFRYTAPPR